MQERLLFAHAMASTAKRISPISLPFQVWSHVRYQLLWAYDGPVAPGHAVASFPARSPLGAWLLREGKLRLTFPDGVERFRAPVWVIPRSQPGRQEFSPDARILSIRFRATWPGGESIFTLPRSLTAPAKRNGVLDRRARTLVGLLRHQPEISQLRPNPTELQRHVDVLAALHRWISAYVRLLLEKGVIPNAPRETDPRIAQAVDWLESQPFSRPWREQDLANYVHLSVSQLNRLFVRDLNTTPLTLHENLRLEAAQQLLEEGSRSIKAIAYELGFSSPGNFSTWFRKRGGTAPRQWRRRQTRESP